MEEQPKADPKEDAPEVVEGDDLKENLQDGQVDETDQPAQG